MGKRTARDHMDQNTGKYLCGQWLVSCVPHVVCAHPEVNADWKGIPGHV